VGEWVNAVYWLVDWFPHGLDRLMGLVILATVAYVVFLAVYAHGLRADAVEDFEDRAD